MRSAILVALAATLSTGLGLWLFDVAGPVTTLRCRRAYGVCELTRTALTTGHTTIQISSLTGARVQRYEGEGNARQLLLSTRDGDVPFMPYGSEVGIDTMEAQAAAVRRFVSNSEQPELDLRRDDRWIGLLAGGLPFVGGMVLFVVAWKLRST
jgi:hypothetical protein